MAFDFPSAPAVGDTFEEGGIKYTWSGTAWDLFTAGTTNDFVLKAGDTMTGPLNFMSDDFNIFSDTHFKRNAPAGAKHYWYINGLEKARLEGDATPGNFVVQGHIYAQNGGRFIFNNTDNNAWQNAISFNGGIHLQYHQGGNNDGRLRVFTSNGGYTDAYVFETTIVSGAPGIVVNGNMSAGSVTSRGGITSAGLITSSVAQGNVALQLNDGARINFSSGCLIYKNYGSNDFMFHTNASQVFTFHISGTGDVYVIDTVGSVGNSVNVTAPESLAMGAELGVACEQGRLGDSVNVMKVMAALLAKVKLLEGEIATLKKRVK